MNIIRYLNQSIDNHPHQVYGSVLDGEIDGRVLDDELTSGGDGHLKRE